MSKTRLIATLTLKGEIVVQSINFKHYLPVGKPEIAIEFLNQWGIDEIVLVDMHATRENRGPNYELIKRCSKKCFVPLTVGGGINTVEQMKELIRNGADKIAINTAAIKNPNLITQGAKVLGSQCIIVSIDVKKNAQGEYEIFSNGGKLPTRLAPISWAKEAERRGAGEIFLNSIDQDGSKQGYDLELIKQVTEAVSIPVIACGGVGHPKHFTKAIKETKTSAVAAGNYFHFTEHCATTTKAYLKRNPELPRDSIRLDSYATYDNFPFGEDGRISKKKEDYLEKLRFEYQPKEKI